MGEEDRQHRSRVTIADVARAAGVSTASVSRVLTGSRPVTPEIEAAVRVASEGLGFRANPVARALRVNSTQTIGLVVPDLTNPFFPALTQAIEAELRAQRHELLLADSLDKPDLEAERVEELLDRHVDGLLISPCHRVDSIQTLERASKRVPVVQLDRRASAMVHYVGMDHGKAMRSVLAHLTAEGRTSFAHIGARPTNAPSFERRSAYLRYFRGRPDAARVRLGEFSFNWGLEATREVMETWPEVNAIVCGDDLIALGALQALSELRISVPSQVAVAGFDNSIYAPISRPPLTSVRQPLEQMALAALALLFAGDGPASNVRLLGEVVARESSVGSAER